jgi:hypothetical protein
MTDILPWLALGIVAAIVIAADCCALAGALRRDHRDADGAARAEAGYQCFLRQLRVVQEFRAALRESRDDDEFFAWCEEQVKLDSESPLPPRDDHGPA